ncbi:MAG TPA: PfkB family carbohydrate kinase [Daejeonella sp.]
MFSPYHEVIEQFHRPKVLVVGDIIMDSYLAGTSTRLSPEAPVPVVAISSQNDVIGGAGNIAINLKSLGAEVVFLSAVGHDENGDKATRLLRRCGIETAVFQDSSRKTMVKTRVTSDGQILARFDYGSECAVTGETEQEIVNYLICNYEYFDIIMLGDYYRGILTDKVIDAIQKLQQRFQKFLAIDSKDLKAFKSTRPTLVKPNYLEATRLLQLPVRKTDRVGQISSKGKVLYQKTGAKIIALTLDYDGAVIFTEGHLIYQSIAYPVAAPNVVGAGDTFISAYILALYAGAAIPSATELSTAASAIAVQKEGTASCSNMELGAFFSIRHKLVSELEELKKLREIYVAQGKKVVFTNGCFDILHSGHISYLNKSKEFGDVLIVAVNDDESIKRVKGPDRPINSLADRMEVLSGLSSVDHIISFGENGIDLPVELIKEIRPHVFTKGGNYSIETLPEASAVQEVGGKIEFVPFIPEHSTTLIIHKIKKGNSFKIGI